MTISKPDLTRVWASSAPPANVVDPDVTIPGKVAAGWLAEVPPFEHFNYLHKWFTQGLAHINERGIAEWDSETVYPAKAYVTGSDGEIYRAISSQAGNDPISNPTYWNRILTVKSGVKTVTDMINSTSLKLSDVVETFANQNGAAINQKWEIVAAATGTPDGGSYIDLTGSGLQAKQIFPKGRLIAEMFGAKPNDSAFDSSAAFTACHNYTGGFYGAGAGDFYVNALPVVNNLDFTGSSLTGRGARTKLYCNANNAGIFEHTSATDVLVIKMSNISARVKSGVTNARFYKQTDRSVYSAYCEFTNVETYKELEWSYEGFFIFAKWRDCIDAYSGSDVVGQNHGFISSNPAAYGQAKQTNLNTLTDCYVFNATDTNAAVDISYGSAWTFTSCDFEQCDTRAIRARGIYGLTVGGQSWFEGINSTEAILCDVSPAPNAQGTRSVDIDGAFFQADETTQYFCKFGSASSGGIKNVQAAGIPIGCVLSNTADLTEFHGNQALSGAGSSAFLTGFKAARNNLKLLSGTINSPDACNNNMLPVGPSGLGSANFTAVAFTGKTDVPSAIGLTGNAISVTTSGSGNALYYTIPAKLTKFLEGKTVTLVMTGYGTAAAGQTGVSAALWENITPTYANNKAASASSALIDTSSADLKLSYAVFGIGTGLTSLHVGIRAGGVAPTGNLYIESMALYVGEILPTSMRLN